MDALTKEIRDLEVVLASMEKDYLRLEKKKADKTGQLLEGLEQSRATFERRLDYTRGRLLTWEKNEAKKLNVKEVQAGIKEKEVVSVQAGLEKTTA